HAWLEIAVGTPTPDESMEAVPNATRGTNTEQYEQIIKGCLTESRRTLGRGGRVVLTFHNNKLEAWTALGNALRASDFTVGGLATVSAENSADHCKRDKRAFLCDLVIECVPSPKGRNGTMIPLTVRGRNNTKQRRNLMAMGRALAEMANSQSIGGLKVLYESY